MNLQTVLGEELRASQVLRAEIKALCGPSYEDAEPILDREFKECSRAYLGRGTDGHLACFYLTCWHDLVVERNAHLAVHLGLSATRSDTKGRGLVARLYWNCLREAESWQRRTGRPVILWSTTASPTVFLAVTTYLAEAEPKIDGTYTEYGRGVALSLRRRLGASEHDPHPFVLKGIATGTQYSAVERRRIERISAKKRFTLFQELGVEEGSHDRLLFIAGIPRCSRAVLTQHDA